MSKDSLIVWDIGDYGVNLGEYNAEMRDVTQTARLDRTASDRCQIIVLIIVDSKYIVR